MKKLHQLILSAALLPALALADAPPVSECLVPASPGGGWDFTCRSFSKVLNTLGLVEGNIQTVNMPGAGGGVGFAHVLSKRSGDESLIVAGSTAASTLLGENKWPGTKEDVRWVGALGADYGVIAVAKDSPFNTLDELLDQLKKDPNSVSIAGGDAVGGWDHLKLLLLAKQAGVPDYQKLKYIHFDGGSKALVQVLGGHVEVFDGDLSEIKGYIGTDDLKVLAVMSKEPLNPPFDKLPTTKDLGIDYDAANWRGFYLPNGVSDETYEWWVDTLKKVYQSDEWKAVMTQGGLMPFHKTGPEFQAFVYQQVDDVNTIAKEIGIIK